MNKIYPSDTDKCALNAPAFGIEHEINCYGNLVLALAESIQELQARLNPVLISRILSEDKCGDTCGDKEVSTFTSHIENNNTALNKLISRIQEIKDSVDF